jgi:Transcriptional regulators of sugar metabolism
MIEMVQERLNKIMQLINANGMVNAADLSRDFGVSIETIRRDLEYLDNKGELKRVYGGAVANSTHGMERDYVSREVLHRKEKVAIAHRTAELIKDGDTVAIDLGTTTLEAARCLAKKSRLTALTNSMPVAMELAKNVGTRVFMLGGLLRYGDFSTSGFLAEWDIQNFRVDKAIISAGGVTLKSGVTDYDVNEANVRRKMIEIASETILIADSSKFAEDAFIQICALGSVDTIVTDWQVPAATQDAFREIKKELIVAQPFSEEGGDGNGIG